jgi:hypothetical protein
MHDTDDAENRPETTLTALMTSATRTQPQRFVLGTGDDVDAMQATGEWLATDAPVEVER